MRLRFWRKAAAGPLGLVTSAPEVKKGTRLLPLSLLAIALLIFIGNLSEGDPDRPVDPLLQLMGTAWTHGTQAGRSPAQQMDTFAARSKAETHYDEGKRLLRAGEDELAKQEFASAVALDPRATSSVGRVWSEIHFDRFKALNEEAMKLRVESGTREVITDPKERASRLERARDLDRRAQAAIALAKQPHLAILTREAVEERAKRPFTQAFADAVPEAAAGLRKYLKKVQTDFQSITGNVLLTLGLLVAYALVAGVAGLIYRRSFWSWFLLSFAVLALVNASGMLGTVVGAKATGNEGLYLFVASQLIVLIVAFRLRRHTSEAPNVNPRLHNSLLGGGLLLAGAIYFANANTNAFKWLDRLFTDSLLDVVPSIVPEGVPTWELVLVGLPTLYALFRRRVIWSGQRPKNIVVCLDGTWNTPDMTDYGQQARTNVYKLFEALKHDLPRGKGGSVLKHSSAFDANKVKCYEDRQIAFYYNGIGNKIENSEIGQLLGGATGMGASGIVERAYLDLVRVYRPGDRIYVVGFSRGAAIARLLARVIDQRGAPRRMWTLRLLGRHWVIWKTGARPHDVPIEVLGCWDTVGAFGFARNFAGINFQRINLFKDLTVPDNVRQAYHMVALDETRDAFVPSLMDADPIRPDRIVEVWFSGNHSNVGGGYATDQLSDVTLDFLLRHISSGYAHAPGMMPGADESWGLYLSAICKSADPGATPSPDSVTVDPNPLGQIRPSAGALYKHGPRELPLHAVIAESVFQRMQRGLPVYAPQSLFNHNAELSSKRDLIEKEAMRLWSTKSLGDEERDQVLQWSSKMLSLAKWPPPSPSGLPASLRNASTRLTNDAMAI